MDYHLPYINFHKLVKIKLAIIKPGKVALTKR